MSPVRGVKNVQEDPTETYRLLTCSICTTHDCCFHGLFFFNDLLILDLDRCEILPKPVDDSMPFPENEPCSEDCYLLLVFPISGNYVDSKLRDSSRPVSDSGIWTEEEISLLEACIRIQGQLDRISCLAAVGLGKSCDKVYSKLLTKNLLPIPAITTTTVTSTAPAAAAAATISEQSRPSSSSRQSRSMSIESSTTGQNKSQTQPVHVHKKRKMAYSSKSSKKESRTEYPADCNLSADNEKRSKFAPCDHQGPCGRGCPCVEDQVHCEKQCACPPVPPTLKNIVDFRIVLDDGEDVLVNVVEHVQLGLVNVINGLENVMLIYVGVVMLLRYLILLILPRNGMGRYLRQGVLIFLFNEGPQRGLLWDVVLLLDGDYSQGKRLKQDNSWGYDLTLTRLICRSIKARSLGMRKVSDGDYCTIRKECHSYLLSIKV